MKQALKWYLIAFILTMTIGCAIGRSWDTSVDDPSQDSWPKLTSLPLYVDGDAHLVERALNVMRSGEIEEFKIVKKKDEGHGHNLFPVIKMLIQPPSWSENWFANIFFVLSGVTFSILPGYGYKSSEVYFQLILPDESGQTVTYDFNYRIKRHYVSWLPLAVASNFVQTVQVWDEPYLDWSQHYERLVRQFFCDAKPLIDEYQARLGTRGNTQL